MTALDGAGRRHRARRFASLLLLAVGWVAVVATSPHDPNDTLSTTLRFSTEAIKDGEVELIAAVNDAAASEPEPAQPLKIDVSMLIPKRPVDSERAPSASLTVSTGEVLPLQPGPVQSDGLVRFELSWMPGPCREACIHSARLAVEDIGNLPPNTTWEVSATIVYRFGEDSEPENAGLVLGLRQDGTPGLLTSNTVGDLLPGRGVLLTPGQPEAHQTLQLEVPRSAIPVAGGAGVATVELVWKGGAMQGVAANDETAARAVLTPEGLGQVTVPVEELLHTDGIARIAYEVPFVLTCDQDRCVADLKADFELLEGPWLILDWSNRVDGCAPGRETYGSGTGDCRP